MNNKWKLILGFIIFLGIVGALWYFLVHDQTATLQKPSGCDQSATTTPCSELLALQQASSSPVQDQNPPPFAFGKLEHTYSDKTLGFSFQYPKELNLVEREHTCPFLVDSPDAKSPVLVIQTPNCSPDSNAKTFDEYKKNFTEYGEADAVIEFELLSSESFKTKSGIEGLYQKFSSKPADGISGSIGRERYIFKLPKKGFLILLRPYTDLTSTYYLPLQQAVAESVTIQ